MALRPSIELYDDLGNRLFEIEKRVTSLRATDEAGQKNDILELCLTDVNNVQLPPSGNVIRLRIGYVPNLYTVGYFTLGPAVAEGDTTDDKLRLTLSSATHNDSFRTKKNRTFLNVSIGSIVDQIAVESSLTPRIDPYFNSIIVSREQKEISSQRLLLDLAVEYDAVFKVQNEILIFTRKDEAKNVATNQDLTTITLSRPQDILTYKYRIDNKNSYSGIYARYRTTGPDGELTTKRILEGSTSGATESLPKIYSTEAEARRLAQLKLQQIGRSEQELSITTEGRQRVFAEAPIIIKGLPSAINGNYIVHRINYNFNKKGDFTTDIELRPKT